MAHTYIYQSSKIQGDDTILTYTVDGFSVTIEIPTASINSQPSTVALQAFLAPLLLAAAQALGDFPTSSVPAAATGTWSQ